MSIGQGDEPNSENALLKTCRDVVPRTIHGIATVSPSIHDYLPFSHPLYRGGNTKRFEIFFKVARKF
jgi:hypothetical protein